jgi:uncharacterized membrane protein (UPF0127 family)
MERPYASWAALGTGVLAILCAVILGACADLKAQRGLERATLGIASATIDVELARTAKQRETGLMYRTRLDEGKGMLFVFEEDQKLSFWMKNTKVPLSIAYISSSGLILDIFDMEPFSEKSIATAHYARYALEVPRGYFGKIGVKAGDTVVLPAIH